MKNRSYLIIVVLVLVVFCMGMGASNAADKKEPVEQHNYVPKTIVDVPWGDKPEEFGLVKGPPETFGAGTFTIDKNGNIYIYDHVKRYIKKFDKKGSFERNIGPIKPGASIAVGVNGHIFVQKGHTVHEYLQTGKLLKNHSIATDIPLMLGAGQGIQLDQWDNLLVNSGYTLYAIGKNVHGRFEALPHEEQRNSRRRGIPSNLKGRHIKTKSLNKHSAMLQILDDEGNTLKEMPMNTPESFGGIKVMGQDNYGYIYTRVGILLGWKARVEVWKYSEEGTFITKFEVPSHYFTEPSKMLEIDHEGNVYQLLSVSEGIKIIKWVQQ